MQRGPRRDPAKRSRWGNMDKAGLTLAGLKVTVGSKSNGNTYLKIVQSEEENREITRNGLK